MSVNHLMLGLTPLLLAAVVGCQTWGGADEGITPPWRKPGSSAVQGVAQDPNRSVRPVNYEADAEPKSDSFTLDDLAPTNFPDTVKRWTGRGPNKAEAEVAFNAAEAAFAAGTAARDAGDEATAKAKFIEAGDQYRAAAVRYPNSSLSHDAWFQAGEAYFFGDAYRQANDAYEELIAEFPGTRYLDRGEARRFAIARYWLQLDELNPDSFLTYNLTDPQRPRRDTDGHAIRVLDRIRLDDPTGRLADDATMALGNAYFAHSRYLDAADTYEDLRKAYPNSPHITTAMLLEIRARLDAYRGADYDGTGLVRSEKLLEQIVKQFPDEVEKNRVVLDELAGEVRHELAQRELTMAQLYDRRAEYRAARIHYQLILDRYEGTAAAPIAQDRMQAIADLPDVPPQRLAWLVDLLPAPRDEKPLFNSRGPR